MKKLTLIAIACALLVSATPIMAQSTVTIYGILDGGYNHVTGLKNGTFNGFASGIMSGSRFGLRGTEEIGNGYKAIFTFENRFELDTGAVTNFPPSGAQVPDRLIKANLLLPQLPAANQAALQPVLNAVSANIGTQIGVNIPARLFDRQAFVGLVTPVGAFTLGRQYTPVFIVGATFDAMGTDSSLATGQLISVPAGFDIRLSNMVQYGIQTGGLTATLMYGAGEVSGNSSNAAGRFWGGMAMYKSGIFSAGYGHNTRNNTDGKKSLTNNIVGASVDVGPGTLYGQYATVKDENPDGVSAIAATTTQLVGPATAALIQTAYTNALRQDGKLYHIGYKINSGLHTVVAAYNRFDDARPNNADASSYGLVYSYALSKRTNLNTVLTRFNNRSTSQVAPGGGGFFGGVTSGAGVDSTNFAFGIRHSF